MPMGMVKIQSSPSKQDRQPLASAQFNVWKRTIPAQLLQPLEEDAETQRFKEVEWMSDLFDATLLTDKVSLSQLRNCHLTSKQTQILATLVPDEVIHIKDLEKKATCTFVGVLLFADVSGFTALCEKYNNTGKGGTYRLTATLNGYIGAMVEVIYSHGGDVLKFSGDAFLAIWKVKRDDFMFHVIHEALSCALYIQQTLGSYETDVKVFLKVKIAISAGNMTFSVIGDDKSRHYICVGSPINDVKMAEHTCMSGDVVLSPSAWGHCSSSNYEYTYKDSQHVKITRIIYNPGISKRQVVQQFQNVSVLIDTKKKNGPAEQEIQDTETPVEVSESGTEVEGEPSPTSMVRPCVKEASRRKLGLVLRPFMIPPVVQQVDADQPLEFLTEMRQVTTMFVNLVPSKVSTNVLIRMVDDAYMIICRLVRTAMGCVNKVSLFDKDVMFLVIFGLRGYKHESEGQSGLKCAYSIRRAVSELQGVACGSVGVTTGMVYCGVVGHPLRREYTIIGAPVNKAARIMCAYPGKVTCDQNTFLHSKLPASSFILQEAKELKGIGTVGAIYEYTEEKRKESAGKATVRMFPILGREEPINIFESLLEKVEEPVRQYSGMLIQGDARVGKSRLLDELVAKAHQCGTTPILVALSNIHMNVPYSAVRQIFNQVLGLSESATSRDIEERLVSVLGAHVSPDELCYLNDVLQVKFPHSAQYLSETPEARKLNTHKIFRDLIHLSCNKLVVAVDDAQYTDQKSWELLFDVLDEDSTLLVMTMCNGHQHNQAEAAKDLLNHSKVLKFHLSGLSEDHLAPLACQILNVKAIAPELEIILQNRSGGNPGWCESFLLSLLQSGGLKIQHLPESEVQCRAFIQPDLWLTEKRLLLKSSGRDMVGRSQPSEEQPHTSMLPTCAVASNYDMSDKGVPQNLDAMIMTAFDSLTPYEQLLLKCASVLGNTFTRTMLDAVMHNPIPRQTAHAVKRLFEMRVLNCGTEESGSASHQPNYVVHRVRNSTLTDHGHTIRCYCQVKSATLDDGEELPKYAFCRLLHFKIPLFRQTTYELLPGNQKKEFHARAVNFLESEAHKCAACGGGDFVYIGHVQLEAELQSKQSGKNVNTEVKAESVIAPRKSAMSTRTACKKEEISESKCINGLMVEKIEAEEEQKTRILPKKAGLIGAVCRNKVQDVKSGSYISIGRTHPAVDFRNCECPLILASVYHQLIDHCTAAGLKEKQIRFLIESGAAAITIGNNTQAINLLTQAMELSIAKAESDENEFNLSRATKKFNLGKIHALLGQANLDLGQLGEARRHLQIAMCNFGRPFITWPVVRNINLQWQLYKQWLHHKFPRVFMRRAHSKKASLYNEIAAALSHLSNLYMVEQEWTLAKLAAIESLNFAQKSSSNLYELCAAYSNMMDVCHHYGKLMYCKRLEKTALQTCKALYVGEEAKELLALGRLYCATFSSRLLRGELVSSIKIGFRTLQISGRVYANNVKLFVLPMLIQALVMNMRLDEAVDLLRELLFTAVEDLDKSSVAWYHALCLDIVLDTCFTVEKTSHGYEFGANLLRDKQQGTGLVVRDPDSVRRLVISMWNWCIRNREWNEAKKWSDIAMKYRDVRPDDSFSNLISALKYLECLLLTITTNLDTPRPSDVSHLRADARSLIKKLNKVAQTSKIILPRFLHLKAYFNCIREYKSRAEKLLAEASQWSEQQQNHLESAWIRHSKMVWTSTINSIDLDFWKEHSNDENCIDWHEYTLHNLSQVTYSLRIPKASI